MQNIWLDSNSVVRAMPVYAKKNEFASCKLLEMSRLNLQREVKKPDYELIPNVGKNIHLVKLNGVLPKCISPPDQRGPEWVIFLDMWSQMTSYYGHGRPGAGWKKNCDLLSQFIPPWMSFPGSDTYSGIFLFLDFYNKFVSQPNLEKLTDKQIMDGLWDCVTSGRAHVWATDWRVWHDWGKGAN